LAHLSAHLKYVSRIDTLYTMIKTFRHKGVAKFFASGSKAGIQPKHANKLSEQLLRLNSAVSAEDMNLPGWAWHPLSKDLEGHWAVSVSGNWRLTFSFEGKDAILVDYQDYH
jgi:toxin HigB-1